MAAHTHASHASTHSHAGHNHAPASFGRAFAIGILLNTAFVVVEAIFGLRANSVGLLADAGHNLSDVLGLVIAWGASVLATRSPTSRRTYGYRASSILAAVANAVVLLIAVGGIAWEAIGRFSRPEPVGTGVIVIVAAIGIVINGITALLFANGRKGDLNIRGAYLHMAADAGVSAGVVIAGLTIARTGWLWLDPAVSIVIAIIIAISTWGLLRDSVNLALDAVPAHIDPGAVDAYLRALPGVSSVHDLHIWGMSTTDVALTAHLVRPEYSDDDVLLHEVSTELHAHYGISHATLQIERGTAIASCRLAPVDVV
jgi:cobalt-zinc-cadmium efflux system protein